MYSVFQNVVIEKVTLESSQCTNTVNPISNSRRVWRCRYDTHCNTDLGKGEHSVSVNNAKFQLGFQKKLAGGGIPGCTTDDWAQFL